VVNTYWEFGVNFGEGVAGDAARNLELGIVLD
jgi:hypothetical protein